MFDYDEWIAGYRYDIEQAEISAILAHWNVDLAREYYDTGDESRALQAIIQAGERWDDAWHRLLYGWSQSSGFWRFIPLAEGIRDDFEEVSAYELTAEKIIEAWAMDNFKAARPTIAFIDRMRQLIWNEPFHVAWAARPEGPG